MQGLYVINWRGGEVNYKKKWFGQNFDFIPKMYNNYEWNSTVPIVKSL